MLAPTLSFYPFFYPSPSSFLLTILFQIFTLPFFTSPLCSASLLHTGNFTKDRNSPLYHPNESFHNNNLSHVLLKNETLFEESSKVFDDQKKNLNKKTHRLFLTFFANTQTINKHTRDNDPNLSALLLHTSFKPVLTTQTTPTIKSSSKTIEHKNLLLHFITKCNPSFLSKIMNTPTSKKFTSENIFSDNSITSPNPSLSHGHLTSDLNANKNSATIKRCTMLENVKKYENKKLVILNKNEKKSKTQNNGLENISNTYFTKSHPITTMFTTTSAKNTSTNLSNIMRSKIPHKTSTQKLLLKHAASNLAIKHQKASIKTSNKNAQSRKITRETQVIGEENEKKSIYRLKNATSLRNKFLFSNIGAKIGNLVYSENHKKLSKTSTKTEDLATITINKASSHDIFNEGTDILFGNFDNKNIYNKMNTKKFKKRLTNFIKDPILNKSEYFQEKPSFVDPIISSTRPLSISFGMKNLEKFENISENTGKTNKTIKNVSKHPWEFNNEHNTQSSSMKPSAKIFNATNSIFKSAFSNPFSSESKILPLKAELKNNPTEKCPVNCSCYQLFGSYAEKEFSNKYSDVYSEYDVQNFNYHDDENTNKKYKSEEFLDDYEKIYQEFLINLKYKSNYKKEIHNTESVSNNSKTHSNTVNPFQLSSQHESWRSDGIRGSPVFNKVVCSTVGLDVPPGHLPLRTKVLDLSGNNLVQGSLSFLKDNVYLEELTISQCGIRNLG